MIQIQKVNSWFGSTQILKDVDLDIPKNKIFSFIGPSGSGKTTLLRSINRLNDLIPSYTIQGNIEIDGDSIFASNDKRFLEDLRRHIGMVFQHPNPLPMTILDNLLLPVKEHYRDSHASMRELAIQCLKEANLYEEVADRLDKTALKLSGGQQQRLCIARALMLHPRVILFDEPCSALDPISTKNVEDLLLRLKEHYTIVMVTHNMEQARRISDYTAFFYSGKLVEVGKTADLFLNPKQEMTDRYIRGVI